MKQTTVDRVNGLFLVLKTSSLTFLMNRTSCRELGSSFSSNADTCRATLNTHTHTACERLGHSTCLMGVAPAVATCCR